MNLKHFLIWAIYIEKEMLIYLAIIAKIHKFCLANSWLDSPMATWLTLTGTRLPDASILLVSDTSNAHCRYCHVEELKFCKLWERED